MDSSKFITAVIIIIIIIFLAMFIAPIWLLIFGTIYFVFQSDIDSGISNIKGRINNST